MPILVKYFAIFSLSRNCIHSEVWGRTQIFVKCFFLFNHHLSIAQIFRFEIGVLYLGNVYAERIVNECHNI